MMKNSFGGMSEWRVAVRHGSSKRERVMLELLLYCYLFANMRFAGPIAAVADFVDDLKTRCMRLVAPAMMDRREPAGGAWLWTEQLNRLDAYVGSIA
jgi:hypothetical protein